MISTNYQHFKEIAHKTQKGFWRQQAIAKLNRQISKGKKQLTYLRDLIIKFGGKTNYNSFSNLPTLTVKHIDFHTTPIQMKLSKKNSIKPRSGSCFFVTQIKRNNKEKDFDKRIFANIEEEKLYSKISFIPFVVESKRALSGKQVNFNIASVEKVFEEEIRYNNRIRKIQTAIRGKRFKHLSRQTKNKLTNELIEEKSGFRDGIENAKLSTNINSFKDKTISNITNMKENFNIMRKRINTKKCI